MQKDLLTEFHFTKLDIKSVPSIVKQNSASFAHLLKGNSGYVKKIKTVPPEFKKVANSMVSDCVEINPSLGSKNVKSLKKKFVVKRPVISSDDSLRSVLKNSPEIQKEIFTAVSNALHENNSKNNSNRTCEEIRSLPKKCCLDSDILPSVAKLNVDTSTVAESNSITKDGSVKDLVSGDFSPKKLFNNNQCSPSGPLLANSEVQTVKRKVVSSTEDAINCSSEKDAVQQFEPNFDVEKESEPALCVISEVVGNADDTFSQADDPQEIIEEAPETQVIVPKKTNDITKIKGWRRKQFFIEKPTTIEFYSISQGSLTLQRKIKLNNCDNPVDKTSCEEPDNAKNAFVCDSLDEFLDRDAELKIGFEIPHLFAEFGIKLTSNEIFSRPNLSEKVIKEVETRYCVPISLPCDNTNLDEIKEEGIKSVKRPIDYYPKPCKLLKVDGSKQNSVRIAKKLEDNLKVEPSEENQELETSLENYQKTESNCALSRIKLVNKFIALVVYPGPYMPLHPIVQYHLAKIRDYHTTVDENWANFAASAVLVDNKSYKRSILPVQCCVKIERQSAELKDSPVSASPTLKVEGDTESTNLDKKQFKLKKCSVVIEKLNLAKTCNPWCMIHNLYNCTECGLRKPNFKEFEKESKSQDVDEELKETVIVSPRASFDKTIATLLAKKVRLLKYNGDTLTSIDSLKTLTPNRVEFIKLKLVKESLMKGYINIWYLKPQKPEVRSRAFLTFSETSPIPSAVNLNSSNAPSLNNLPKVITEIISEENTFDSNEYAILHCNGEIWEIHGSLNIAFGKNEKNVEQIFTSVELPELEKLQKIAFDILRVKTVKWWVLDLTQKFRFIELKSGNLSTVVIRKKFLETIAMINSFGFLPLRKDSDNRVVGAYIFQRLLPFVLIGPYYLLEPHDLILRGESSILSFTYNGLDNVAENFPLKFFINSVIKSMKQNNKQLEGLWLYDKMNLDRTSYLEVVTTTLGGTLPNKHSNIDIEHGYSLSSLTSSSSSGATSGIIKRKDGKEEFKKVPVYLYFDVFGLGFVEGELQFDNSVIISHPLDRRTKMKSHKIGDWFIGIIKRRIEFMPKNLTVRWFITKHKDDLRNRRPFNKFFLGGAHILTKKGIYYLLEMSESKIKKLGLNKSEVLRAIENCEVIKEVKELKNLANLLTNDPSKSLSMDEVLSKTVEEIQKLKKMGKIFKFKKLVAQREKLNLVLRFLEMLNLSHIPFHIKMKMIEGIEVSFKKENGNLNEDPLKITELERSLHSEIEENCNNYLKKFKQKSLDEVLEAEEKIKSKLKSKKLPIIKNRNKEKDIRSLNKSPATVLNSPNKVIQTKEDLPKYPELHSQIEKLNSISDRYSSFKNIYSKVIKNYTSSKGDVEETFEKEKIKNKESAVQNSSNNTNAMSENSLSEDLGQNLKVNTSANSTLILKGKPLNTADIFLKTEK